MRRKGDRWPLKNHEGLWLRVEELKQDRANLDMGTEAFTEGVLEFLENTKVGVIKEGP